MKRPPLNERPVEAIGKGGMPASLKLLFFCCRTVFVVELLYLLSIFFRYGRRASLPCRLPKVDGPPISSSVAHIQSLYKGLSQAKIYKNLRIRPIGI
jgi:hypothetical protein